MQSIIIAPEERKDLIQKMKRERQPSRRLRMHIVLLASDGFSPTEIARVLFCSRTTVYAVARRFVRQKRAAFLDRKRRGLKPLLDESANERIERLLEEEPPTEHGWLRSRWSCKLLAVQLFKERMVAASRETIRRTLHRLEFRWRRPRPVPPEKDSDEYKEEKRTRLSDVLAMLEKAGSFFQDETKLETNRKVWISGALNFHTGRFLWVSGELRNDELFIKLLEKLRGIYRCHKELHLAVDNDGSHISKRVEKYVEDSAERIHLHPLPSWSPESNPVELVWWSLHEAVSRNHQCVDLDELVEFAEGYLEERQPFMLKLGEVAAMRLGECSFISWSYLALPPPPPGHPGPFALADAGRLSALVGEAGFRDVETGAVSVVFEADTPAQYTEFVRDVAPPFTALLKDHPPDVRERIWGKVSEAYRQFVDSGGRIHTTNEAIWVSGTK